MLSTRLSWASLCLLASCACTPEPTGECVYAGASHQAGTTFSADDGCNQCVCGDDGTVTCTQTHCAVDGGQATDAASDDGAGIDATGDASRQDIGPITNEVVPIPSNTCQIISVNEQTPTGNVAPGDAVVVSAASYPPPTAGHAVTAVVWSLVRAPAGSHAYVSAPAGVETALGSSGMRGVDLIGTYVLRAMLTDDVSATTTHDCKLEVTTDQALYVELVWDSLDSDVDIHISKQDGQGLYCVGSGTGAPTGLATACSDSAPLDCHYANCKQLDDRSPDWDSNSASHTGDPLLVVDDLDGHGPEVIRDSQMPAGSYLVAVNYFSDHSNGPAVATLRVWMYGQLRGQAVKRLEDSEWWEPFVITWPASGDVCIADPALDVPAVCHPAPQCQPAASCVQCSGGNECGPGSHCSAQRCQPDVALCLNDQMCESGRLCQPASDVCSAAQCTDVCADTSLSCSLDAFVCFRVPASCSETNEPNDSLATAIDVTTSTHADVLCRGDVDVLRVAGATNTFAHFSIAADNFSPGVEIKNASGELVATTQGSGGARLLMAPMPADGILYLVLDGSTMGADLGHYTVDIAFEPVLPICLNEPGEPNDAFEQSVNSQLASGTYQRALCRPQEIDHHWIEVPSNLRVRITVSLAAGSAQVEVGLLDASAQLLFGEILPASPEVIEHFNRGTSSATVVLRLRGVGPVLDMQQSYQIDVDFEAIAACETTFEPNDDVEHAHLVAPGTVHAMVCSAADPDFFAIDLARGGDLDAQLGFDQEDGDLDLYLWNPRGRLLDWSTTSGSVEHVSSANLEPGRYTVEVQPYRVGLGQVPYALTIAVANVPDAGVADAGVEDASNEDR